jgi:hypothetical protein
MTGQISKTAEEDLKNMRDPLANIEWRQNEARGVLEAVIARRRDEIHARHELEREGTPHYESHATFDAVERSFDETPKREGLDDDFGLSLGK